METTTVASQGVDMADARAEGQNERGHDSGSAHGLHGLKEAGEVGSRPHDPVADAAASLRLTKLTLSGFKSFADTTEFTFEHPITGIVGPNGCGKSNVVDAIKWVLGERSSKSLRGTEMLDVIFAGSAGRKPLGLASVKLTFDNPVVEAAATEHVIAEAAGNSEARGVETKEESGEQGVGSDEVVAEVSSRTEQADEQLSIVEGSDQVISEPSPRSSALSGPSAIPSSPRRKFGRMLPVDSDTVEIERRLYRDGGSEYLINGKQARLKDIREMFLDTGVGADAYSIIEQGKVDAMLLASPQERRIIFEEAAGIAKYKQRRIEAQRRLDRAEANLKIAKEELESTERRLRLVKGQAAKARKFQEYDSELKAWQRTLAMDQHDLLLERIEGLTSQQNEATAQRDEAHAQLMVLEQQKAEAEALRHEQSEQVRRLEQERMSAMHMCQQSEQRKGMLERLVEQIKREGETDKAAIKELTERAGTTDVSVTEAREQIAALSEQLAEAERRLQDAAAQRAAMMEQLGEKQRLSSQRSNAAARIDRERVQMVAAVEGERRRGAGLKEQLERVGATLTRIATDRESVLQQQATATTKTEEIRGVVSDLESQLAACEQQLSQLGEDRRVRAGDIAQLDQDFVRTESRRATLEEMAQQRVGFAEAVRRAMSLKADNKGFGGVIAPLADLIEIQTNQQDVAGDSTNVGSETDSTNVQAAVEQAIEVALADDLQALVVENLAGIAGEEELRLVGGRLTFVPLSRDGVASAPMHFASLQVASDDPAGRVVQLRSLVKARAGTHEQRVSELLDVMLGKTFLVTNLDAAMMLLASMRGAGESTSGVRFITRRGEVLDESLRVTAGPAASGGSGASASANSKQNSNDAAMPVGLLRRRVELEHLARKGVELGAKLASLRDGLAAVDGEASALSQRAGELRSQLSQQQKALLGVQATVERLGYDATRLEREHERTQQEQQQSSQRLEKLELEAASMAEKAASLARLAEEELAGAAALSSELASLQTRADASSEQVTAAKVEVGTLSEQLSGAKRALANLEWVRDDLARRVRDVNARLSEQESRLGEHAIGINEAIAIITNASAAVATLAGQFGEASQLLEQTTQATAELNEQVAAARQRAAIVERDFHSLELSRRELEVKREGLEDRAMQELSLDLRIENAAYRQLLADVSIDEQIEGATEGEVTQTIYTFARPDHDEAQRAIDDFKREIKKLGSVNMEALDEELTLEGQNEQLVKQVADIEQAREQLSQLIAELNEVSKTRFEEIFGTIQEQFGGERGMFRKLFGGGRAEVRLMPLIKEVEQADGSIAKVETNDYDVLESGIEVIAKPPGKEPRSISQLSGGEKTLTAVALLMSIFRSKPSCFCILDEVDAALDEGNVGRFNNCVRDFTDLSRFIIITHNKRTMQNTDHLYGITQQEKGVSTRVSVRFDQVGKDGSIHASAKAEAKPESKSEPKAAAKKDTQATSLVEVKPVAKSAEVKPSVKSADVEDQTRTPETKSLADAIDPATARVIETVTPNVRKRKAKDASKDVAKEQVARKTEDAARDVSQVTAIAPVTETPKAIEPPVVEVVSKAAPVEPAAEARAAEVAQANLHVAPLGIGENPEQSTTLGMSPLKRALAKLRETMGE
ncbi:MAG: chromosome segregation protein SMC [Phycisphaerales bacterium]